MPLRWTGAFGATSYKVKRATTKGGPYTAIAKVAKPGYVDTSVVNGANYYYVVRAVNAAGEGANSAEDAAMPMPRLINVATGGSAKDNSNNVSGNEGAAKAFVLNAGSKWLGSFPGWLQHDLGAGNGQAVIAYDLISANDAPTRDPKDWQFQGSNDGVNWTTLDAQTGQSFAYRLFPKRYFISKTTAWRYNRLHVTANAGGNSTQLAELALLKSAASVPPPVAPTGLLSRPVSESRID